MTDYHNFDEYNQGETWDYNGEFQTLDALVWKTGTLTNRPDTAPDDRLYLATDEGTLYQYDGGAGSWTTVIDDVSDEGIEDVVGALVSGGADIDVTYDDAGNTLTIDFTGTNYSAEQARDDVGAALTGGNAATVTIDDANDTITVAVDETAISHTNLADITSDDHHTKTTSASDLTDVSADSVGDAHHARYTAEEVEDVVAALLTAGTNVSLTYDDANDTLTIDATDTTGVDVEDGGTVVVNGSTAINFGTNLSVTDDGDGTVTVAGSGSSDTRIDLTDGTTSVAEPSELLVEAINAAGVTLADDGDGTATLTVDATDTDTTDHAQLTNVQSDQHHTKYTDTDAQGAVTGTVDAADLTGASGTDGQVLTSDGSAAAWESVSDAAPRTLTLADTATDALLDTASTTAKVTVIDGSNDELAEYFVRGSNTDAQLVVDSATNFSETEGNAGTINVYWDSTNSRYEIENQTGASVDVTIHDRRA